MRQAESHFRRDARAVVRIRPRPPTPAVNHEQRRDAEILTDVLQPSFEQIPLGNRRNLLVAEAVAELLVETQGPGTVHRRRPEWSGRRLQVGQHVRVPVALDFKHTLPEAGVQATLGGGIIVQRLAVDFVDDLLLPGICHPPRLAVHESGEDVLVQDRLVPLQRFDQTFTDAVLVESAVVPIRQVCPIGRAEVVHEQDDAFRVLRIEGVALCPHQRPLEQVSYQLPADLEAGTVGAQPHDATGSRELAGCEEGEVGAPYKHVRLLGGNFASRYFEPGPFEELLLPAGQPARNEVLPHKREAVGQAVLADVIETSQSCDTRGCYGVPKRYKVHSEVLHQHREQAQVLAFRCGRIYAPNDRSVPRAAFPVEQMITVQPLLIEPQDFKRQPPCFQQGCNHLEVASAIDQVTRRVFPLVGNNEQEAIGQWRLAFGSVCRAGNANRECERRDHRQPGRGTRDTRHRNSPPTRNRAASGDPAVTGPACLR